MNLTLTLNQEQTDALNAWVNERNANGANVTAESHLTELVMSAINGKVASYYEAAVKRIGAAAAALPYADRLALIQQIESQVA